MATAFAIPAGPAMDGGPATHAGRPLAELRKAPGPERFSADEFLDLGSRGFFAGRKVELVDGELWEEPLHGWRHGRLQARLIYLLASTGAVAVPVGELSVRLSEQTVRDFDAGLTHPDVGDVPAVQPSDVVLAVKIAVTTLAVDLNVKSLEYAEAGVPHYWVVDVEAEAVHVMTGPGPDGYAERRIVRFAEPLQVPGGGEITIAEG